MNKNHAISTRRIKTDHYQVVVTNVQSGKCLKVLCDMVREPEMTDTEFERYCEGTYQGFVNPKPLTEIMLTDFSHLHALEERARRIRERMRTVRKNETQWKSQATQLFQTEREIADEREFLGLEDMDVDKLYAALSPEVEYDLPTCESCGKTLTIQDPIAWTDGQCLLCFKCEQLERCDACEHFHEVNETCGKCGKTWSGDTQMEARGRFCFASGRKYGASFMRALRERSMLDPDAPDAIVVATDQKEDKWLHNHPKK